MRIISGIFKGRSINFLRNSKTRPLKDNVKENIFNILEHSSLIKIKVKNCKILDLYSGIGSFGIECISRGAEQVTFVEQDTNAFNILRDNLIKLSIINKSKIYNNEIMSIFDKNIDEKFNIFFLDPPFADLKFVQNIKLIKKNKIFKQNHIVIIHRERKTEDDFENHLKVVVTKHYGRSKIVFGVFN